MNSLDNIRIARNVVLYAGKLLRVLEKSLHLLFCTTIPELEVIEHCIVLLGKALIGVLNGGHVRAHLVSVIGHIRNCHVCIPFLGLL